MQEAVNVWTKMLGPTHSNTIEASETLLLIRSRSRKIAPVTVSRANVDELVAMGFSERAAAEALALRNGDVNDAAVFLLNCGDASQ